MTVILLRHGRSTANTSGVLAGRGPGVHLDDRGRAQADDLVRRLGDCLGDIRAVARSPLDRCAETVAPLLAALGADGEAPPEIVVDDLAEVDYGGWTGRSIRELLTEPLWKVVQQQPSAAVFPDGEGLADVQARAVRAIRELDRIHGGPDGSGVWIACSHGDVIKSVIADAMGTHLDSFQRIVVDPASISVIRYSSARPYVHTVNATDTLSVPKPPPPNAHGDKASDDAMVGGETGADAQPVAGGAGANGARTGGAGTIPATSG
ncbi:MSMEG_4193 family putative phosphomutase [Gordonia sp. zg691]|uniref:MSMEG_4193 family putative phosphomutase n=1 Tax=Gordonia jinghuaiqii TaxID=2758710 RepID=A0A7D7LV71_9ACTN|nr:MSMEG_4193 family putative phosphomutase [Gordonia jinghuaiqii]MBD0861560.1 MSMEG_4193 family putative phosphomutase [Gordonia jinghuaiqii]MCR5976471.1 MSMEG_4193 family putative phosphomutase [Gordonia jinghuaiqii]QMS99675.1 MSMEG_4193 family putative phosphomutase [Gordonia jinghuaiqii]